MAEHLSFISKGAGSSLIRYVEASGIRFQFKTGHSFYRTHRTPDGNTTDFRTTTLTLDWIEAEIVADILLFFDSGGSIPLLDRSFRHPVQREIAVGGCRLSCN